MTMFTNPANGHQIEVNWLANVGALLFGPLYFAARGVWTHFAIMLLGLIVGGVLYWQADPETAGLVLYMGGILWCGWAVSAQIILRDHYLATGWRDASSPPAASA